jgi:hypothetical protein
MTVLTILLACLLVSVSAGLAATVYVNILTQPGQVLAFWARTLFRVRDTFVEAVASEPERMHRRTAFADSLLKPLLTCVYCVGGQMGFWLFLISYVNDGYGTLSGLVWAVLTAFCSVFFAGLFQAIQLKYFPYE